MLNTFITESSSASGRPTENMSFLTTASGMRYSFLMRTNRPLPRMYQTMASTHENPNDITVAQAAPATPMSIQNIIIGSRTMFTTAPAACMIIERLAAPSPRSIPAIMPLSTIGNVETNSGKAYPMHSSAISSAPIRGKRYGATITSRGVKIKETWTDTTSPWAAAFSAPFLSFIPM